VLLHKRKEGKDVMKCVERSPFLLDDDELRVNKEYF
jgi:hypothetical protein